MRVAIIGAGAVASIHAAALQTAGATITSVCDASLDRAEAFARKLSVTRATGRIEDALDGAEAAIVATPSDLHFSHAIRVLEQGLHALVEMPPCGSADRARTLLYAAERRERILRCAHTSRYLEPYRMIKLWLEGNRLGVIRQVHYIRFLQPVGRDWVDNALLHHAAHPVDVLFHWFGDLRPCGGAASPLNEPFRDVCLSARLPNDAPVSISISYSAVVSQFRLTVVGQQHTVVANGFESIESDDSSLSWIGNPAVVYPEAIAAQDRDFLKACAGARQPFAWTETTRIMDCIGRFKTFCSTQQPYQN
jgi:predicted dehydrogenase